MKKKIMVRIDSLYVTRQANLKFVIVCLTVFLLFSACDKDEANNGKDKPLPPIPSETPVDGRFDNENFKWDYIFTTATEDDVFIGDKFISVENRYLITPPSLYVGAVYREKDFATSFRSEITAPRNPIDIIFDFTRPFTGSINREYGSLGYKELLSNSLDSKEYKEYIKDRHSPYDVKLVEIYSYEDIHKVFLASDEKLGELLSKEVEKDSWIKGIKSRLVGEISSKSFTVYMDYPVNGFFKDKNMDDNVDNPVYIRSISYGKAAFFVIESKFSYKEVEVAILSKFSLSDAAVRNEAVLKESTITLFTVSNNIQTAKIHSDFRDLDIFLNTSFQELSYGYPIYCQGVYTKDNRPSEKTKN